MNENIQGQEILGCHNPSALYKVKTYDFKRPDKFSKEQIRTMAIMYETFAMKYASVLSGMLSLDIKISSNSIDQSTYEEFISGLDPVTPLASINMSPLPGPGICSFDPGLLSILLDRLFGGNGTLLDVRCRFIYFTANI